jgi:hypothetical protein
MSTNAQPVQGLAFKRGNADGPPETFTTIADLSGLDGPNMTADTVDVTDFASTAKQFLSTFVDPGDLKLTVFYRSDYSGHQNLRTDFTTKAIKNFQIVDTATVPVTCSFTGVITAFSAKYVVGQVAGADITIKLSGLPVWT